MKRIVQRILSIALTMIVMLTSVPVDIFAAQEIQSDVQENADETITQEIQLSITKQPGNYVGAEGSTASFKIEAKGAGLKYQWQWYDNGKWLNSEQTDAKTASLSVVLEARRSGRKYRCIVSDSSGASVTSKEVTMTIGEKLEITKQPENYVGVEGSTANFKIEAKGTGLKYQWQWYTGSYWADSEQANGKTNAMSIELTKTRSGRKYRCIVSDSTGASVTSKEVTMTIGEKLAITKQPENYVGVEGSTATFKVEASGTGLKYQWQWCHENEWLDSTQEGSQTSTISVVLNSNRDGRKYRCIVSGKTGASVTSKEVTMTIGESLAITNQPTTLTFEKPGDIIEMEITATGTGLKYQWQYKPSWSGTWTNFEGATTSFVQKKAQEGWNGWLVRCVVTDIMGNSVTSDEVKIVNTSKSDGTIYTVTLDANGGYFNEEDGTHNKTVQMTVEKNLPITYYDTPVIDDDTKIFGGWYDNKACTGTAVQENNWYADANTTYYAKWIDAYVVTFDGNGGTFDGMSKLTTKVPKNRAISGEYESFDLNGFGHASKTLSGWSLDKAGTQPVEECDIYRTVITKNTTYYAQWMDAVTVTYDANGGYFEGTGDTDYKEVTSDFVQASYYFGDLKTNEKKVFDGWYLDKDCTKKAAGTYLPDKNYTFYAKWADAVEITYNANGGTAQGSDQVVRKVKKNTLHYLNEVYAEKDGAIFDAWYLDQACTEPAGKTTGKQLMDKDLVVYAGWKEAYTLTYDANGGYFSGNVKTQISTIEKGKTAYISSSTSIYNRNKSLAFDGWYLDKELTQPTGDRIKVTKDTTVYAKWSPACTLTFNANGGTIYGYGETAQFAVAKGKSFSADQSFEPHYENDPTIVFDGWYLDKDCTQSVDLYNTMWDKDTTLYAKWSQGYRVVFDANGGYFYSYSATKQYWFCNAGGTIGYEPTPNCKDTTKVFAGWYLDKGLTKPVNITDYEVNSNMTVYAKYERGNVVTFDANGGHIADSSETTSSWTLAINTELGSYRAPSVENNANKVMLGWALTADGTKTIDLNSYVPTGDVTLYAVWEEGYTVTFDANGGYFADSDDVYIGETVTRIFKKNAEIYQVGFPTVYARDKDRFVGWYKDKECTEPVDTRFDIVDKDLTIYAKWEKTVDVTFDANGWTFGSYDKTKNTYTAGSVLHPHEIENLSNITAVDGKVVSGWYLNPECTEDKRVDLSTYKFTEDVTLYAKWEKGIVVTYDACGGYFDEGPGGISLIKTYTLRKGNSIGWRYTDPKSNDSKKVFAGWYLDKEYKEEVASIYNYVPKDDVTLYAKWENGSTVTFNAGEGYFSDGPGANNAKIKTYTVRKGKELNNIPSCYNSDTTKVFAGWYTDANFTNKVESIYNYTVTGDVTLYAKWETGVKVTFEACGGTFSNNSETRTVYAVKGTELWNWIEHPSSGTQYRTFQDWYLDADYTQQINSDYIITDDITLYAKWTECVKVTLDACGGYFTDNRTQPETEEMYVPEGNNISWELEYKIPENTDDHKAFDGWYFDSTYKNKVGDNYVPDQDTTLYAKWTDGYKITFDAGEGYFNLNYGEISEYLYKVVKKGDSFGSVSYITPSHNEKGFAGWCLTSDRGEVINDLYNYVPEKDITLYAKWVNKYTITYDACGGYFNGDQNQTTHRDEINEGGYLNNYIPTIADDYKAFDGWYLDEDYTQKIEDMYEYYPKNSMTVYAKWTEAYKVTFDACGGVFGSDSSTYSVSVKKGSSIRDNSIYINEPSNGHKVFDGWYLDADYTKPVDSIYSYVPDKNTTIYAKWADSYKVTYDGCGGYFGDADTTTYEVYVKAGEAIRYNYRTPDRDVNDHEMFDGWYLDAEYTQPVDELYSYVPEKDTVFYAKWADSYVITFDAGEGYYSNGADGNSQYSYRLVKKGAALNGVSYNDPYHDEKAFDGWCLTPDCEETIDAYNYVPDKDTTLYAKWANQYTITYDACGGYFWGDESNTTETSKVKEGDTLNSYTPSNADEHKIFDGWYLDPTYEHKIENMYEYKPEKDMTVYAKWADAYKLTYDACGGNFWGSEEPHTYYVKAGDKVEYRYDTPSNGDKTFLGWYLDAEYTQPVGRIYDYVPEKDTTFYAKWEEDTSDEDDTAFVSSQNATDSSSEAIAQEPTEEPTTSDASAIESTEPTATPAPEVTEVPETVVEEDQNTESETPNAAEEETETAEETISEQNVTEQEASAPEAVVTENN